MLDRYHLLQECLGVLGVVRADVFVERAHQDERHHAGEEEHDHEGVEYGEPVDLRLRHLEVGVPPGGPLDVRLLPVHRVQWVGALFLKIIRQL